MTELSLQELYELYLDTLSQCTPSILEMSDEDILCILFEEFASSAWAYLHIDNLSNLRNAGLIDDAIVEESQEIRRCWLALEDHDWTIDDIRHNREWSNMFNRCNTLKQKVLIRNTHAT